jgi:hypothetical protein
VFLLYSDESGMSGSRHFVLAGVAAFERRPYWLSSVLDQIQLKFLPDEEEPVEFHASEIRAGKNPPWNKLTSEERHQLLDAIYDAISEAQIDLFASVIDREWLKTGTDVYSFAFESILNRFDRFLRSKFKEEGEAQRGIIIIAESQYRLRIETLANKIRKVGTRWGEAYNLCEVPLFTSAGNSRMLQVADFCANAIYGKFESGYSRQYDRIASKFFEYDGIVHGLAHYSRLFETCMCPGCLSRRLSGARLESPPDVQGPLL